MKRFAYIITLLSFSSFICAQSVNVVTGKNPSNRVAYAAEYLQKKLGALGYTATCSDRKQRADYHVALVVEQLGNDSTERKEGYQIKRKKKEITVRGNDGNGLIYGCVELADYVRLNASLDIEDNTAGTPRMVLRGACVGLQKTEYLPGHQVYEYPYTPENFPWFYDKQQWIEYLDMLVDNRMNSLYLWNGHPFASLVKLKDYPFAVEVDDATFQKNKDIFSFLTHEADRRGIFVIQMFYNILLSKPFADHYGLKTQDRNRPITPLVSDYTRKSVAAFIENYPNVGLLVCLGEAMATYEDDVEWFTKTILPGVKDGLKALGRTDEPPVLLRSHDTDCKMVMEAALPIYKNLYTMSKYTGESLTTYEPGGPWGADHRALSSLGPVHIENVHILANLEPWRWSSPDFVQKTVKAMHGRHAANGLHLYPQASYWDWPYTADKLAGGQRERQLYRDWMWYKVWGRYAWDENRDRLDEMTYWDKELAAFYGLPAADAANIRTAYEESGEIAPKLIRRFGITEGNRQTLLLGMFMSQLVNPYKYTIYPGFYESCGPEGEKLIEYVEKEWKGQPHVGELPLDIASQVEVHGRKAVEAIDAVAGKATLNKDEFERLRNDMHCYRAFADAFAWKVRAAQRVLNYQWGKDISELDAAVPLLERSLQHYRRLVELTKDTYLYANSMQTAQRRIPIGGDGGKMKTWIELLPKYEEELANLKLHIAQLKEGNVAQRQPSPLRVAKISTDDAVKTVLLEKGARLFSDLDSAVVELAPELAGQRAYVFNSRAQRDGGTVLRFTTTKAVSLLVGYFRDDQKKYAKAPKLEIDATANDYNQAEPQLTAAIQLAGMPQVNVHKYDFAAGTHTLSLPKGMLLVLGCTNDAVVARNVGLSGSDDAMDWLFY